MPNPRDIEKVKIALPIAILFFVGVPTISCSYILNYGPVDCGFSAYYDTKDRDGKIELVFSRVTAEGNDPRNCGFNYIKTKVDRAEIDGTAMPERADADKFQRETYFYAAPPGFDLRKNTIKIEYGGKKYVSDLTSVEQIDTSCYIKLKSEGYW
jgi:hypothetical protein